MRNNYHPKLFLVTSIILIFVFVLTGCAPVEIKKVTAQKADYYKFTSQNYGFKISVDPYKEEDRLQEYFGCDLLSKRVLPVLVVIENINAEDGYILMKEKSRLLLKNPASKKKEDEIGKEGEKTDELQKSYEDYRKTGMATGIAVMTIPALGFAMLPFLFASQKKWHDEVEIRRNLEGKQIVDKTVYKGGSHNGFLYFQLIDKEDINRVQGIHLSMKNIRSSEIVSFTVNISN